MPGSGPNDVTYVDQASVQVVASDPKEGAGHPVVSAVVRRRAVRNELGKVV